MVVHNKLVRDKIPAIIAASGRRCEVRQLDPAEHLAALEQKLGEELREYLADGEVAELADLVEVIYGILALKGVSPEAFEQLRLAKRTERGGFDQGLWLVQVDV